LFIIECHTKTNALYPVCIVVVFYELPLYTTVNTRTRFHTLCRFWIVLLHTHNHSF